MSPRTALAATCCALLTLAAACKPATQPQPDAGPSDPCHCLVGERCLRNVCVTANCSTLNCPVGTVCLKDECVDSACVGVACGSGSTCVGGNCYASSCASGPCPQGQVCSNGACVSLACAGVTCGADTVCIGGECLFTSCNGTPCPDGEVCSGGACTAAACVGMSCPEGRCLAGACTSCPAGQYPVGGSCVAQAPLGNGCALDSQCQSGHCTDGVCCESECTGACQACNAKGQCAAVAVKAVDPACGAALCAADGTCGTSCSSDAECITGAKCTAGVCKADFPIGTACANALVCASGHCADGVCCDGACNGPCDRCDLPGAVGQCGPAAAGSAGKPSCGAYACNGTGSECPLTCTTADGCAANSICAGGHCLVQQGQGTACSVDAECASGACVDGVCCNNACTGPCMACNLVGKAGACSPVADKSVDGQCGAGLCGPQGACVTSCTSASDCYPGASCDGGTCVADFPPGSTCLSGSVCASGNCADGVCCNTACAGPCDRCDLGGSVGTCTPVSAGTAGTCAPYTCGAGGACRSSCSQLSDCAAGSMCLGGACVQLKQQGEACTSGLDCMTGSCSDGVCCSVDCTGQCMACNLPGQSGYCTAVPARTDPEGECGGAWCSGNSGCQLTCSSDAQCKPGSLCTAGVCTVPTGTKKAGELCTDAGQCISGFCADGVCCDGACSGPCNGCALAGSVGKCINAAYGTDPGAECGPTYCDGTGECLPICGINSQCKPGSSCSGGKCTLKPQGAGCGSGGECLSGVCSEGVCCGAGCTGICQTCNDPLGTPGVCVNIPSGTDPSGECGNNWCTGSAACATSCSGNSDCKPGSSCVGGKCTPKANGYSCTAHTECASSACVDGVCCNASCNGTCQACNLVGSVGSCINVPSGSDPGKECAGFVCNGSGACTTSCASASDCVATSRCVGGKCTLPAGSQANGTGCVNGGDCQSGSCVDGVCCSSDCAGPCQSCSTTTNLGTCTFAASGTDPAGECGGTFCNGSGACLGTCTGPADCKSGSSCASGQCTVPATGRTNGTGCTQASQCGSGFCVDGVCCSSACNGTCRSCNETGKQGSCTFAAPGTDPGGECGGGSCGANGICNSACASNSDCKPGSTCTGGQCSAVNGAAPAGTSCSAASDCASQFCVDGVCCDSACTGVCMTCSALGKEGSCSPVPAHEDPDGECRATWCSGSGGCLDACATNSDCKAGASCAGGVCQSTLKPDGTACSSGGQCISGHCADGVCCNKACNAGPCDGCSMAAGASDDGVCTFLGSDIVCRPSSGGCDPAESCNGLTGACPPDAKVAADTVCQVSGSTCAKDARCDGVTNSCPALEQLPEDTSCGMPVEGTWPACQYDEPCGNVPLQRTIYKINKYYVCRSGSCSEQHIVESKQCPDRNRDGTFCNDGSQCGAHCGGGTCSQRIQPICSADGGCHCP